MAQIMVANSLHQLYSANMERLFFLQDKLFTHPKASTMLEDLAIKGIQNGFSDCEVIAGIMRHYRQCEQVASENLLKAKAMLA
jgi:hypothetical protein